MSIEHYLTLQKQSTLNQPLNMLTPAILSVSQVTVSVQALIETVNSIDATCGWVMYRDSLAKVVYLEGDRTDLIEGEWFNGSVTLKAKLISGQTYALVKMEKLEQPSDQFVFKPIELETRYGLAEYLLWYQNQQGRWQAVCQQFVGFNKERVL